MTSHAIRAQQIPATSKSAPLVVGAEYGMPYSRRIVDRLAACIGGSRLVVIPSVTHFMSYQEPDLFNDVVLDSVSRH